MFKTTEADGKSRDHSKTMGRTRVHNKTMDRTRGHIKSSVKQVSDKYLLIYVTNVLWVGLIVTRYSL